MPNNINSNKKSTKKQQKNQSSLNKIVEMMAGSGAEINKSKPAIESINYTKKFGSFISTKNVSFKVNHGVIHGFIGPNGSGKTTTIKALIGAYRPTKGKVQINGHKSGSKKANELIGYIPERASFPKHLNSVEYLKAMGEISGLKSNIALERAQAILVALGLEKQSRRKPISFSSGMQKKILLAQALLTDPSILILDEPAANLDPSSRKELFDQLIELKEQGKTIFISSHILAELERIVDEITFLYYGEMLYSGPVAQFINEGNSVFIKTSDNKKLKTYLDKNKLKYKGKGVHEIEVLKTTKTKTQKIFKDLSKLDLNIISFRANDLQTSYETLSLRANKKNKGIQSTKLSWKEKRKLKRTQAKLIQSRKKIKGEV